jgi:hypothetical protein
MVSSPPGVICTRVPAGASLLMLLVKLSPGDHVRSEPIASGTGERVMAGSSCCTLPLERSWRRLPPSVSVPQP